MPYLQELLDDLRSQGVPESALLVPMSAHQDKAGLFHGAVCTEGPATFWQKATFIPATSSPSERCMCMTRRVVVDFPEKHWNALAGLRTVARELAAEPAPGNPREHFQWFQRAFRSATHVSYWGGHLDPTVQQEMRPFLASLQEDSRAATLRVHAALVENLPTWYQEQGLDPTALAEEAHYLMGVQDVYLRTDLPRDFHLYLATFLSPEAYLRLAATGSTAVVLRVPTSITSLLDACSEQVPGLFHDILLSPDSDTPAVMENIRALWSPRSGDALSWFTNAVAAARQI